MNLKECIASRLRDARESSGLSQNQVANILNLKRPAISEIEAGRRKVTAEELIKFSEIYKVDLSWLACKESDKREQVEDKLQMAARELSDIKEEDLDKVIKILTAFKRD